MVFPTNFAFLKKKKKKTASSLCLHFPSVSPLPPSPLPSLSEGAPRRAQQLPLGTAHTGSCVRTQVVSRGFCDHPVS